MYFYLPFPEAAIPDMCHRDTLCETRKLGVVLQIDMNCQDGFGAGGFGDLTVSPEPEVRSRLTS